MKAATSALLCRWLYGWEEDPDTFGVSGFESGCFENAENTHRIINTIHTVRQHQMCQYFFTWNQYSILEKARDEK
jgi:hypothetical protein